MRLFKLIVLASLLQGCSVFTEYVDKPYPVYYEVECNDYNSIRGVTYKDVIFKVTEVDGVMWVSLTPKDYENLSTNMQDTLRYIKNLKSVTRYLETCIDDFNEGLHE